MSHRSVITVQIGQCGIQIGKSLWSQFSKEHYINESGICPETDDPCEIKALNTFYYETSSGRWMPKTLFIDSEPGVIDALQNSALGQLFNKDFILKGKQDCRNVMGLAWYPTFLGSAYHRRYSHVLRRLLECCESISGTMYYMSTCGGTGTGLTCRILQQINELQPKTSNLGIELTPSPTISNAPLEVYNNMAYYGLTRYDNLNMNIHFFLDNEALYRIARNVRPNKEPTLNCLNRIIARCMSNMTSSLRFDGQLNVDLNEFQTNLVPFRTMNNLILSNAPIQSVEEREFVKVRDITLRAFRNDAYMCSTDPFAYALKWPEEQEAEIFPEPIWFAEAESGKSDFITEGGLVDEAVYYIRHKFMACSMMYRGDVMPAKVNTAIQALKRIANPQFVRWVPTGFKVGITNSPAIGSPEDWPYKNMNRSLTCITNSTVVAEKLKHFVRNYRMFMDMSAYQVWTAQGGIEQSIVEMSKDGMLDLISQYEYSMGTNIDIGELQDKLLQQPTPLGTF